MYSRALPLPVCSIIKSPVRRLATDSLLVVVDTLPGQLADGIQGVQVTGTQRLPPSDSRGERAKSRHGTRNSKVDSRF